MWVFVALRRVALFTVLKLLVNICSVIGSSLVSLLVIFVFLLLVLQFFNETSSKILQSIM